MRTRLINRMSLRAAGACACLSLLVSVPTGAASPSKAVNGPQWVPMPLISAAMRQAGVSPGGEGAQVIRSLAISPSDPKFLMMGTDVGGIYRSLDGGGHWQVCMSGWLARGSNAFAIDPKNPKRVLGVGGNSMDWNPSWGTSPFGLYLSTDQGAHWRQVLPHPEGYVTPDSLAWDRTTYDAQKGGCLVAYYESRDGLLKTTDGGETWKQVNDHGGATIAIHPSRGYVYLADGKGFFKSTDGGATFRKVNGMDLRDVVVLPTRPDTVYVSGKDKVQISTDAGETFKPVGANAGLPDGTAINTLGVSPADPQEMLCNHGGAQWYESYSYSSQDGGASWHKLTYDHTNLFLPFTQPGSHFVFDPITPGVAFSELGTNGSVVKSADGGKTFHWSNNGDNAVMPGGSFGFNPAHPNAVYLSFQDFNGATTADGGHTWAYCNPSGQGWGGFQYGGYALDARVMWSGDAPSWGGPRTLKVSRDGGTTWTAMKDAQGKDIVYAGPDVSNIDPAAPAVCFASNWHSADGARTWTPMAGCDAVYTATPGALLGRHGKTVCRSTDHGATWTDLTPEVPGGLGDIAFDPTRRRLYVASENQVKAYDLAQGMTGTWTSLDIPKDSKGGTHVYSVCVDTADPAIVYAAGPANTYATDATVVRSTDAGKTWENLTVTTPLRSVAQAGGPHEVEWVRVNPATRELWAAGECYGMWKIVPPQKKVAHR